MKEMHPVTIGDFKEAVMDLVTILDRGFRPLTVRITLAFIGVLAAWLLCSAEPVYAMENQVPTAYDGEVLCVLPDSAITDTAKDQDAAHYGPAYRWASSACLQPVKGPGIDPKNPVYKDIWDGHFKRYITYAEIHGHLKED